jgi:hypothetical protein
MLSPIVQIFQARNTANSRPEQAWFSPSPTGSWQDKNRPAARVNSARQQMDEIMIVELNILVQPFFRISSRLISFDIYLFVLYTPPVLTPT